MQKRGEREIKQYYFGFQSKEDKMLYFDIVHFHRTTAKLFVAKIDLNSNFGMLLTGDQFKHFECDINLGDKPSSKSSNLPYCVPLYNDVFQMFKYRFGCSVIITNEKSEEGKENEITVGRLWFDNFLKGVKGLTGELTAQMADIKDGRALLVTTERTLSRWECKGFLPCREKHLYFM